MLYVQMRYNKNEKDSTDKILNTISLDDLCFIFLNLKISYSQVSLLL